MPRCFTRPQTVTHPSTSRSTDRRYHVPAEWTTVTPGTRLGVDDESCIYYIVYDTRSAMLVRLLVIVAVCILVSMYVHYNGGVRNVQSSVAVIGPQFHQPVRQSSVLLSFLIETAAVSSEICNTRNHDVYSFDPPKCAWVDQMHLAPKTDEHRGVVGHIQGDVVAHFSQGERVSHYVANGGGTPRHELLETWPAVMV